MEGDVTTNNDKRTPVVLRSILDALTLEPFTGFEKAGKAAGIHRTTIHAWQKQSADAEATGDQSSVFYLEWLSIKSYWHRHIAMARGISIQGIDARLREMALVGTTELMFNNQTGMPIWKVSPQIAADALSLDDFEWEFTYGKRDRKDVFVRENGKLVQERKPISPNPQLLIKACSALLPQVYGEHVKHSHQITVGGVLRIGPSREPRPQVIDADFTAAIEDKSDERQSTNVLAVSERCTSSEHFEQAFGGRRLVEAVLFRDEDGTLLPPLPGIVIVRGSPIHKAYADAGIEVETREAGDLLRQGFCNPFLCKLAATPEDCERVKDLRQKLGEGVKNPRPRGPSQVDPLMAAVAQRDAVREPIKRVKPGKASSHYDSENVGPVRPPPGGRSILR
jgi:hypothetical protein